MKNLLVCALAYFLFLTGAAVAEDVVGFWKIPNDKTGKIECIICVYKYDEQVYGRIIARVEKDGSIVDTIHTPIERAPGVEGTPYYAGLDMIWGLKSNGNRYVEGKVLDPQKGKLYNAEMWAENGNLVLRGKLWIFGQNRVWLPLEEGDMPEGFEKPDLTAMVPAIPKTKRLERKSN